MGGVDGGVIASMIDNPRWFTAVAQTHRCVSTTDEHRFETKIARPMRHLAFFALGAVAALAATPATAQPAGTAPVSTTKHSAPSLQGLRAAAAV
jgi:hypothetical protein